MEQPHKRKIPAEGDIQRRLKSLERVCFILTIDIILLALNRAFGIGDTVIFLIGFLVIKMIDFLLRNINFILNFMILFYQNL